METQSQYNKNQNSGGWEKTILPIWGKFFIFRETPVEEYKSYTYLATAISSNGIFKANIQQLCKTASRAMYTLLSHTNKYWGGNIKSLMDLYNSEV